MLVNHKIDVIVARCLEQCFPTFFPCDPPLIFQKFSRPLMVKINIVSCVFVVIIHWKKNNNKALLSNAYKTHTLCQHPVYICLDRCFNIICSQWCRFMLSIGGEGIICNFTPILPYFQQWGGCSLITIFSREQIK